MVQIVVARTMEKKTYYILTRDLEDPSTQGYGVLWGMTLLSNYVYGTTSPLALKGELFEALPADEQSTAVEDNVSLRGLKQKCLQVKCPKEDLKMISGKEAYTLLAVQSYSERCIIVNEKQSLLSWGVADNEGCQVSVWIDDMKKFVAAVIHYKGALPPYDGVMFGIEIVDPLFCNRGTTDGVFRCQRYFKCAAGAGMFVSLDKIRIPLCKEVTANAEAEENVQDDYTHITVSGDSNGDDSGMESSGHSIMEAEVFNENGGVLNSDKNLSEQVETNGNNSEIIDDLQEEESRGEELLKFKHLYLKEKKMLSEIQNLLEESKMKISSLEKNLHEERVARESLSEKCNTLQIALSEQVLHQSGVEFQLEEQKSKIQKMQKCFMSEWKEFEKRLIEERASKVSIEQQLSDSLLQLEKEKKLKAALQKEVENLTQRVTCQEGLDELKQQPSPVAETCDWLIERSEVEVLGGKILGTGGWGVVTEGRFRGCRVAVKQIHELILSSHNRRLFMREMTIASRCRHPCLLQFIGATNDDGVPLFITELMDISLRDLLEKQPLTKAEVVTIALDIARALNYLHMSKPPIIHRDISSANVLLWRRDNQWQAKVSDYGTANFMRKCRTMNPGAVIYSAPEALSSDQSPKIDVYSFGLLLCEMCIRELPVPQKTDTQIFLMTDQDLRDLVMSCVRDKPKERPNMAEVLRELEQIGPAMT